MSDFERYNHLNKYLKEKFGERVLKICIDGGFSCPNRGGTAGEGGCIFCGERGSGEHLNVQNSISSQVKKHLSSYRGERANKFIAYFQNFSNTYDTVQNLKEKYDSALIDEKIVALAVATRPDCIDEEKVKLLKSYSKKYYVWVELGLQTSNEETAKLINRGYNNSVYTNAVELLNKYEIDVVTHIMIGLPNETKTDIENTVKFINAHNIQGLKIHSTYIIKNTILEKMYNKKEYTPITLEYYIDMLVYIITRINKKIIIHRITGDAPKDILIAPEWNIHKKLILNGLEKELEKRNAYQGSAK